MTQRFELGFDRSSDGRVSLQLSLLPQKEHDNDDIRGLKVSTLKLDAPVELSS